MSEAVNATAESVAEIAAENAPAEQQKVAASKPDGNSSKVTNESLWEDKVTRLNADLHKERSELKTIKQQRDELAAKVSQFELQHKKSEALNTALSTLGEDFEVSTDKMKVLNEIIGSFQDSENLPDVIAKQVELVKAPKVKEAAPLVNTPFRGPATVSTSGKQLSEAQKMELAVSNPDEFRRMFGSTPFNH